MLNQTKIIIAANHKNYAIIYSMEALIHKLSNPYYLCIIIGIAIISGVVLSSTNTYSESATATVTVGSACTLTATVGTAHSAEIPAGSSQTNIGSTTLNTICNDAGGFAIYAVGYSNNEYGNNKMLSGSSYEFNTGTGTTASNWNMKLSQVTTGTYATTIDGGFGSYSAIPSTFTKVAHRDSATDAVGTNPAVGSSISLTYGAYISTTQNAGTYEGKVKFTLVHPATEVPAQPVACTAGKICYNANGSNAVGTMAQQSAGNNASATLYPSNFSRQGYGFAGWSITYDYSDSTGFYGPNETITTPADTSTNGLPLYAIWVKATGVIQDWAGCSTLTPGSVIALKDQRDDNVYAVSKLADGNCWMIENLRLNNDGSSNTTGALAQGYGGQFVGLANPESPWANNNSTANSLYSVNGADNTVNIGTSNAGYRFPRYNNQNTSSRANNTTVSENIYSYGHYYTMAAAIADTADYTTDDQSVTSTSICPSGWHLPAGGRAYASDSGANVNVTGNPATFRDYYKLSYHIMGSATTAYEDTPNGGNSYYSSNTTNALGDTATKAFRRYPNNFVYSGNISSSSINGRGTYGSYWTSTIYSNEYGYRLDIYSSYVTPGTGYNYKNYGRTVRCLTSGS